MGLMYVIINANKQVINFHVGEIEDIKNKLLANNCEAVEVTIENSPINQGDYYDGIKFVKELSNV